MYPDRIHKHAVSQRRKGRILLLFFFLNKLTVFSKGSPQLLFTPSSRAHPCSGTAERDLTVQVTQEPTVLHHIQASSRMIERYPTLLVLQAASHSPYNERKSIRGPPRMLFCSLGAQFVGLVRWSGSLHILVCNRPSHSIFTQ